MEIVFHKTVSDKKLSLLCYQISIAKPDIILFVTGPYYARSMEAGLMLDSNSLETSKPSMDKLISDISFVHSKAHYDFPKLLWTYHPASITRKGEKILDGFYNELRERIP